MEKCAKNLKRIVLELGGKDPLVVFADADLDKAAEDAGENGVLNNSRTLSCSLLTNMCFA